MTIDYNNKEITIPEVAQLSGHQIYQMVAQDRRDNAEAAAYEDPYGIVTVKLGNRTGAESIDVGESIILLQRLQLQDGWKIILEKGQETEQEAVAE